MKWRIGSPSRESRVVPSGRWPLFCSSRIARQRFVRVLRQWTHSRHWGEKSVTTWSPGSSEVDAVADALDDAGALVAEHRRRVAGRVGAGGRVEVGVADAAGDEPDEHLAGLRLGQIELLHRRAARRTPPARRRGSSPGRPLGRVEADRPVRLVAEGLRRRAAAPAERDGVALGKLVRHSRPCRSAGRAR